MTRAEEHQDWIDSLAGRDGRAASEAAHEARSLRAAMLRRAPAPAPFVLTPDGAREDALVARARREGILPRASVIRRAEPRRGSSSLRRVLFGWRGATIAAAIIVAVAGAVLFRHNSAPPPETVRGAADRIVRLVAPDPHALQQTLIAELRAAGVQATGYEMLGRWGVVADLPQPVPPAVRDLLGRRAIPLPAGDELHVEVTAGSGP